MSERISIRVNGALRALLENRMAQTSLTASEIVRDALQSALRPQAPAPQPTSNAAVVPPVLPQYTFPTGLDDLKRQYRAFGAEIWKERRLIFRRLLAACELCRENSQAARDEQMCGEVLRVGREFRLIP
jgi:hypothetical protein